MILAIDTSSSSLAIALADKDGNVLHEFHASASVDERGIHDARLASVVANLLISAGAKPSDITRIGLIIGPGSFTGLRIGLSFAKGLAYATGASLVPVTQHEAIAAESHDRVIVTAGYKEGLFYVAEASSPREVRLMEISELPPNVSLHVGQSISIIAKLTAKAKNALVNQQLDALEPLYLTEFSALILANV